MVGVTLKKQYSRTRCVNGGNYGFSGTNIWVDRGCRAKFNVMVKRMYMFKLLIKYQGTSRD